MVIVVVRLSRWNCQKSSHQSLPKTFSRNTKSNQIVQLKELLLPVSLDQITILCLTLSNKTNHKQVQIRERKKPIVVLLANETRDDGHVMLLLQFNNSTSGKLRGKTDGPSLIMSTWRPIESMACPPLSGLKPCLEHEADKADNI